MGIRGQKCNTSTGPQQSPTNHQQIPPLEINTSGIPVYQLYASAIQSLLKQSVMAAVGDTHGSAQESKAYDSRTEFKVSEGGKQKIKKCAD